MTSDAISPPNEGAARDRAVPARASDTILPFLRYVFGAFRPLCLRRRRGGDIALCVFRVRRDHDEANRARRIDVFALCDRCRDRASDHVRFGRSCSFGSEIIASNVTNELISQ